MAEDCLQASYFFGLIMPSLQVSKDLHIHYDIVDYLDPWADKPVLILQHGNGRSSEFWYRWMPRLVEHFVVIRPDMRGVGKSSRVNNPREDISVEKCVQDLAQLIQSQSNGPGLFLWGIHGRHIRHCSCKSISFSH
jgi:3-oxoadipate enol-lactonase